MKPQGTTELAGTIAPNEPKPFSPALMAAIRAVLRYYPVALIFLLWELSARLGFLDPIFVPALSEVLKTLENFVDPLISALFPTPKLAIFPLMMVFLGIGDASKIALIFLGCFFPIVISTYTGVKNVDKYFIWNARTKGANHRQVLWTVVFPAAMPFVFAGLRVATSTAFLLIVASELIAANEGLGYLIIYAQRTFNPTLMFSGVLMVACMGFIVDRLLLALGRWLFAWQDKTGF